MNRILFLLITAVCANAFGDIQITSSRGDQVIYEEQSQVFHEPCGKRHCSPESQRFHIARELYVQNIHRLFGITANEFVGDAGLIRLAKQLNALQLSLMSPDQLSEEESKEAEVTLQSLLAFRASQRLAEAEVLKFLQPKVDKAVSADYQHDRVRMLFIALSRMAYDPPSGRLYVLKNESASWESAQGICHEGERLLRESDLDPAVVELFEKSTLLSRGPTSRLIWAGSEVRGTDLLPPQSTRGVALQIGPADDVVRKEVSLEQEGRTSLGVICVTRFENTVGQDEEIVGNPAFSSPWQGTDFRLERLEENFTLLSSLMYNYKAVFFTKLSKDLASYPLAARDQGLKPYLLSAQPRLFAIYAIAPILEDTQSGVVRDKILPDFRNFKAQLEQTFGTRTIADLDPTPQVIKIALELSAKALLVTQEFLSQDSKGTADFLSGLSSLLATAPKGVTSPFEIRATASLFEAHRSVIDSLVNDSPRARGFGAMLAQIQGYLTAKAGSPSK